MRKFIQQSLYVKMIRCEADVEAWVYQLEPKQIEETLLQLSLRKTGSKFLKLDRLLKWLRGEYPAAEFEQTDADDEESAPVKREELRRTFIEQTCLERSSSAGHDTSYSRDLSHPLPMYHDISDRRDLETVPQQRNGRAHN